MQLVTQLHGKVSSDVNEHISKRAHEVRGAPNSNKKAPQEPQEPQKQATGRKKDTLMQELEADHGSNRGQDLLHVLGQVRTRET